MTILLFIFGIGAVAPKMIQNAMIAQGDSRQEETSTIRATANEFLEAADTDLESLKPVASENMNKIEKIDENIKENEENFPIKSAGDETVVQNKNTASVKETTQSVDSNSSSIDKAAVKESVSTSKDAETANTTVKPVETAKAVVETPVTATPVKIEITFKDVSYTRWVIQSLNMRKGPGTEHSVLTSIPTGEELKVTALASNGWSEVSYNGKTGYVSGKYLSETIISKPAPAPAPTPAPTPAPAPVKPTSPSYDAYKMYIAGKAITYKNGGQSKGQSIIDSNSNLISTWGGAGTFSGTDGMNTHFIGHNPGIFSAMLNVSNGNTIVVTDGNASPTTYKVTKIFKVDDYGINPSDGENYYNYLVSTRGGEVITLQTCLGSDLNLIIRADKIN